MTGTDGAQPTHRAPTPQATHRARAFGLTWVADTPLDGFDAAEGGFDPAKDGGEAADVTVARVAALPARTILRTLNRGQLHDDGLRFDWNGEATFDLIGHDRIDYLPGPAWTGRLPDAFYGTLAALVLAAKGMIPFHACMVEVAGHAVLIAGRSGAGKSSLTAGLIGVGARFVADDLAAVRVTGDRIEGLRGRPGMRQHRDTAAQIDADLCHPIAGDARGKWLVRPRLRTPHLALPVGGLLVLGDDAGVADAQAKVRLLAGQLFRPRWLAALPGHAARRRDLLAIAAAIPVATFPAVPTVGPRDDAARAAHALARIEALVAQRRTREGAA